MIKPEQVPEAAADAARELGVSRWSEATTPTVHFRFVKSEKYTAHILQQMHWVGNRPEWRDVPIVDEEPLPSPPAGETK